MKITDFNLTGREKDILEIMWNANKGMTASEIAKAGGDVFTINTAQAVIKKLLNRDLIKVDEIVHSGTVLCRSYVPVYTEAEFRTQMTESNLLALNKFRISPAKFMINFINENEPQISKEEAAELMELINSITK